MQGSSFVRRLGQRVSAQAVGLRMTAHTLFRRRRFQYVALAAVLISGSAYALDSMPLTHTSAPAATNTNNADAQKGKSTSDSFVPGAASENHTDAAVNVNGSSNTSSSANVMSSTGSSSNTSNNSQATVTINGKTMALPPNGSVSQHITTPGSNTFINVSNSSSGGGSSSSSSVDVQVNSSTSSSPGG